MIWLVKSKNNQKHSLIDFLWKLEIKSKINCWRLLLALFCFSFDHLPVYPKKFILFVSNKVDCSTLSRKAAMFRSLSFLSSNASKSNLYSRVKSKGREKQNKKYPSLSLCWFNQNLNQPSLNKWILLFSSFFFTSLSSLYLLKMSTIKMT